MDMANNNLKNISSNFPPEKDTEMEVDEDIRPDSTPKSLPLHKSPEPEMKPSNCKPIKEILQSKDKPLSTKVISKDRSRKENGSAQHSLKVRSQPSENSREVIYYNKHDVGPFKACLFAPRTYDGNRKAFKTTDADKFLHKAGISYAIIEKSGFNTWVLTFTNKSSANDAVNNKYVKQANWSIFIPRAFVYRQIVIRDVPAEAYSSLKELMEELKKNNPNLRIKDLYRLNLRLVHPVTNEVIFEESDSVKILIRSTSIPQWIWLWKWFKIPTSVFIPRLRICYCCGYLNHATKFCRNSPRCLNCGEEKHAEETSCSKSPKCISCDGPHRTFSNDCPKLLEKREINEIMALENVNCLTAKRILDKNSKDQSLKLSCRSSDFSPLQSKFPYFKQITTEEDLELWEGIESALSNSNNISLLLKRLAKAVSLHESLSQPTQL